MVFITGGFLILGHCADKTTRGTYQGIVGHYVGPWGVVVCDIIILSYMFGTLITYLVSLADQLDKGKLSDYLIPG